MTLYQSRQYAMRIYYAIVIFIRKERFKGKLFTVSQHRPENWKDKVVTRTFQLYRLESVIRFVGLPSFYGTRSFHMAKLHKKDTTICSLAINSLTTPMKSTGVYNFPRPLLYPDAFPLRFHNTRSRWHWFRSKCNHKIEEKHRKRSVQVCGASGNL